MASWLCLVVFPLIYDKARANAYIERDGFMIRKKDVEKESTMRWNLLGCARTHNIKSSLRHSPITVCVYAAYTRVAYGSIYSRRESKSWKSYDESIKSRYMQSIGVYDRNRNESPKPKPSIKFIISVFGVCVCACVCLYRWATVDWIDQYAEKRINAFDSIEKICKSVDFGEFLLNENNANTNANHTPETHNYNHRTLPTCNTTTLSIPFAVRLSHFGSILVGLCLSYVSRSRCLRSSFCSFSLSLPLCFSSALVYSSFSVSPSSLLAHSIVKLLCLCRTNATHLLRLNEQHTNNNNHYRATPCKHTFTQV